MRYCAFLSLALALVSTASATTFVLDDFSDGVPSSASVIGNGTDTDRTTGSMFGGSRGILAAEFDTVLGLGSSIVANNGVVGMSNDVGNSGTFWIYYLSLGALANGFTYDVNTDIDMTGVTGFEIDLLTSDKPFNLRVFWTSSTATALWSKAFVSTNSPTTITISVADEISNNGMDFGAVDSFFFAFDTEVDGDLAITEIRAVPEPATMVLAGAGLAFLARRRRQA